MEKVTEEYNRERKLLKETLEVEGLAADDIIASLEMEMADEGKENEGDREGEKQSQDNMVCG